MAENNVKSEVLETDKTTRLVDYLIAISRINSKIVRSFDDYSRVLWVHSIPRETGHCFTQAWGKVEDHEDIWVEVKKIKEPELPKIPTNCKEWVAYESLRDLENIPELKDSIIIESVVEDSETGEEYTSTETYNLEDWPSLQEEWEVYLENKWFPWRDLYERYSVVQKVYAELFNIYQEQQKLAEQYELVFCSGLLSWRTPNGQETQRHILTMKASIEFEPHLGKFTVKPAVDGGSVELELSQMLDVQDYPQNIQRLKEDCHDTIGSDFWGRGNVDTILSAVANSLSDSGEGEYWLKNFKPEATRKSKKPIVEFAPALILRKRSQRGLEQVLSSIREQIEIGIEIPGQFLDLCECSDTNNKLLKGVENSSVPLPPESIYFPLPANNEQQQIIKTLNCQNGVLVQGPPGTGKTHTIANLICHLLATGERVLVTAKSPRALQVLHDKLPKEIRPLCINLLGEGAEERESLARSVSGILKRIDNRNDSETSRKIEELKTEIDTNQREKADTEHKLVALREAETFTHNVAEGKYTGTAANIARILSDQESEYSWFTDRIEQGEEIPLNDEDIQQLSHLILSIDLEIENDLSRNIPGTLQEPQKIRNAFRQERECNERIQDNSDRIERQSIRSLITTGEERINELLDQVSSFYAICQTVRQRPQKWVKVAIAEVLTDTDMPWKERLRVSKESVNAIRALIGEVDKYSVVIPDGCDRKQVLSSAHILKNHFDSGGGTGLLVFKPKIVREHTPVLEKVSVNGIQGNSPGALDDLIDYLTVEQGLEYAWKIWRDLAQPIGGPFPLQVAEIDELNESLESVVDLYVKRNEVQVLLQSISGLRDPQWADLSSLEALMKDCRIALAKLKFDSISQKISKFDSLWFGLARKPNAHPIVKEISNAISQRDAEKYSECYHIVEKLKRKSKNVAAKRNLIGKLAEKAPELAGHCASGHERELWSERLQFLAEVWAWAQGRTWLFNYLESDVDSLQRHLVSLDKKIKKNLADLASLKSWEYCFNRMKKSHSEHLMAWQQSMKKLGKGTGKYAATYRKQAQQHLNKCRDAVPAWVMPLHRVYESVAPIPGIFDVVIVDEASQCGPESLPLLYLGKKVLVVGDDKQISPEAVGIDKAQIQKLMNNHLSGFEHADSFDVDSSLFDHGRIRFSNRISLREHFRCMPEMIRFSNDLCYGNAPLIPLRQYSPDRLEPLKSVFVGEGYREGSGARVINKPEAEAVVQTIIECCKEERYQGMTMGVIVLQGEAQGYLIQELLLQKLGAEEIERRRLMCGNPYSFQGDERDVIFLSMVAAPNERIGSLTKEPDQRRFNVAASRALEQMWLFHSATINDLSKYCYRKRLLEHFLDPTSHIVRSLGEDAEALRDKAFKTNRQIETAPEPFDSWFEVDVALRIAGRGYRVVPQFKFADKRIDIVIQGSKAQLAVECDGDFWHGPDEYVADMERQRKLERCGWTFFRVRESLYYANPDEALGPLWGILERMGIVSLADESSVADLDDDKHADDEPDLSDSLDENEQSLENTREDDSFEEDDRTDWEELDIEGGFQKVLPGVSTQEKEEIPQTIQEALAVKPSVIRDAIINVLKIRPNNSAVKATVAKYILQMWKIKTRGKPRDRFVRRVNEQLAIMDRAGHIIIYKAKNVRIKLGWKDYD